MGPSAIYEFLLLLLMAVWVEGNVNQPGLARFPAKGQRLKAMRADEQWIGLMVTLLLVPMLLAAGLSLIFGQLPLFMAFGLLIGGARLALIFRQ